MASLTKTQMFPLKILTAMAHPRMEPSQQMTSMSLAIKTRPLFLAPGRAQACFSKLTDGIFRKNYRILGHLWLQLILIGF
jgi:hypothetical protein